MHCLVIGGTLFIGRLLVQELVKRGYQVTVMHRKSRHDLGRKVGNLTADRNDAKALAAAVAGKHFDVVFDNVYDWERGTTAAQVEETVKLVTAGHKIHRYVFMSSVAAYGDGLNHHESDALAPDDHTDAYVRNKAMSERMLFRMHHRSGLPVVTLRPPFIYGPQNPFYREAYFWDRLRAGRSIILPGDGRRLMQFVYVKDLVEAAIRSIEEAGAIGQAFNIANPRPVSQAEAVDAFAAACRKPANVVRIPRERLLRAGGHPMGPKLYFGMYYDMPPITQITNKSQRILKLKATPFDVGLKETYRWYLRNNSFPKPDYTFEDEMLAKAELAPVVAK
jgi:nucleoside-diphosphate-sugar epimerase